MTSLAVGAVAGALASSAARHLSGSTSSGNLDASQSKNVGILAIEAYTPRTYVSQSELETQSGVAPGKYTIGLGQEGLAITGDAEDINSISLTVCHALLEK